MSGWIIVKPLLRVPLHVAARAAATASVATTDSADSVASTDAALIRRRAGWPVNPTNGRGNMTTTETNPIDEARLEAFVRQAVTAMGAALSGLLLHIGDRLGLYKAMAGAAPVTSAMLAARTGTAQRYVREWLGNQAAGGYVTYDPAAGTYELPAEQAMVVANENSPVFLGGAFRSES